MYHSTPTNQASEISFDEPVDLTECPDNCPEATKYYGYAHIHCAVDGCILYAEGGGGDDGRSIGGYTDALTCRSCKDPVARSCAQYIGDEPFCFNCTHELANQADDDALLENGLANASEDIRDSHKRMLRETDTRRLKQLRDVHLPILEMQILLMKKAIDDKLAAHTALPKIFGAA